MPLDHAFAAGEWQHVTCGFVDGEGFLASVCAGERPLLLGRHSGWVWVPRRRPPPLAHHVAHHVHVDRRGRAADLLSDRPFEVLPLPGRTSNAPSDGAEAYWLHIEGDSTVVRAEKEELVWLLNGRSEPRVMRQRVTCFHIEEGGAGSNAGSAEAPWRRHVASGVCGNRGASAAIMRHTRSAVNVYEWPPEPPRRPQRVVLSVSLAGGVQGNCVLAPARCHQVGRCHASNLTGPMASPQRPSFNTGASACASMPGTGSSYFRGLFRSVGSLVGSAAPTAMVLGFTGLHFNTIHHWLPLEQRPCSPPERYVEHLRFLLASLRREYAGPVLWRSGGAPQWDPRRLWGYAPLRSCDNDTHMRRFSAAAEQMMARDQVPVLAAGSVVEGWANATSDNWHFDGGVLRSFYNGAYNHGAKNTALAEQVVTLNLLNVMLNALAAITASAE